MTTRASAEVLTLTQAEYRADPRLATHSRIRRLLPPSTPAHARWELDHPTHTGALDLGRAAHRQVLRAGDHHLIIAGTGADENAWRTNADKASVAEARQAGLTPITPAQGDQIAAMSDAIRRHPLAPLLLDPAAGQPEQAILWPDDQVPVQRGVMIDWLPSPSGGRRLLVCDYKTSAHAHPTTWAKSVADFGYHTQAAWILDGLHAAYPDLTADDVAVLFVVQSTTPPYPVVITELDEEAIRVGRGQNRWAIQLWHRCWETGVWPGYSPEVEQVSLPAWYASRWEPIAREPIA